MTIPPRFLDEIRGRLTLSSVIGKKTRVVRAGREFKACCPFHKEKTPSFTINDDKQFFHCFGCGAHGDVIGFIMRHDNLSFPDAIEALAAEAGLQVPRLDPETARRMERERDLYGLMDEATSFFEGQRAKASPEIQKYIDSRRLSGAAVTAFRVGYAPGDGQALRRHLKDKGFTDQQMIEAGILKPSSRGGEPYVFFRDRIIFPVADRRGRVIALGGRILPDHLRPPDRGDFTPAKYVNSPDTPLFDKSRVLYAESFARHAAGQGDPVIVAEGYMDVIACHMAGFRGAVAPMGTALTDEQILKLWAMIPHDDKAPILCFDGDAAGIKAATRAAQKVLPLLKPDHTVKIALMPAGEDPDSLIGRDGAAAFRGIIDTALGLFDYLWLAATQGRDLSRPETRAGLEKALKDTILTIADRTVQAHYMVQLRQRISAEFFRTGRNAGNAPGRPSRPTASVMKPRAPQYAAMRLGALVAAVINHPGIFPEVEEALGMLEIENEGLKRLRDAVLSVLVDSGETPPDAAALREILAITHGLDRVLDDIMTESLYVHAAFASPAADPSSVGQQWQEWRNALTGHAEHAEARTGWSQALESGNEDGEARLRARITAGA